MSQYKMYIHHDREVDKETGVPITNLGQSVGHFYVSLENNHNPEFFGINPTVRAPIAAGKIDPIYHKERFENANKHNKNSKLISRTFDLTKEQYELALDFAKEKQNNPNTYVASVDDCITFTQEIYNKAGKSGFISSLYSARELKEMETLASGSLERRLGSLDNPTLAFGTESLSKDEFAAKYNLKSSSISESSIQDPDGNVHKQYVIDLSKLKNSDPYTSAWNLNYLYDQLSSYFDKSTPINKGYKQTPIPEQPDTNFQHSKNSYTIKAGDRLWTIADKIGVPVEAILLIPGNEKYIGRTTLGKNGEVRHVEIHPGDVLNLPTKGSKVYAGDLKQKFKEMYDNLELKNAKHHKNKNGHDSTEVPEDAYVEINGKKISAQQLMVMIAEEQAAKEDFILENFIKIDPAANAIFSFTSDVYAKLFGEKNIADTGKTIGDRLLKGEKIEAVSEDLIRTAVAQTVHERISNTQIFSDYEKTFTNTVGKEIIHDFAINLMASTGKNLGAREYRMMAYSSANKIVAKNLVNDVLKSHSNIIKNSAATTIAHVAMSVIAMKGQLSKEALINIGVSGIATYAGSYMASTALASMKVATAGGLMSAGGLALGLVSGGLGAVISMAITSMFGIGKQRAVSTYIESHTVRINAEGALEYVTMRPEGTIIIDLGNAKKVVYGRGASDTIIVGSGDDKITLLGLSGGFVEGGGNSAREQVIVNRNGNEVKTYIYKEKIIGSEGSDNKLDGQDGDDYINGRGGNDYIKGGAGNDLIDGGDGNDTIEGEAGDDTIDGGKGDDHIDGGEGDDVIFAGEGNDGTKERPITGGKGKDTISGGSGDDYIYGDDGDDIISGDDGDDKLGGGNGNDFIYGGKSVDRIYGGEGSDTLSGGEGDDFIYGDEGNDLINGDEGNDKLHGGKGDDLITGGVGNDYIEGGIGNDKLFGGLGKDTYNYRVQDKISDNCVNADLLTAGDGEDEINDLAGEENILKIDNKDIKPADLNFALQDNDLKISFKDRNGSILLKNFATNRGIDAIQIHDYHLDVAKIDLANLNNITWQEDISGNNANQENVKLDEDTASKYKDVNLNFNEDEFSKQTRTLKANVIVMISEEHDEGMLWWSDSYTTYHPSYPGRLDGKNNHDKLVGNYWSEQIYGHGGNDEIYGNNGDDHIDGGDGNDKLLGGNGNDVLHGKTGNDKLNGNDGTDTLYGNEGDDDLYGDEGNDYLYGGVGKDNLFGGKGVDILYGEQGDDSLAGEDGDDDLYGGEGDDRLSGGKGTDKLEGGAGKDTIYGGEGNDTINGEDGDDLLVGNQGDDTMTGGAGDDEVFGSEGDDTINGNDGDDYLHGGVGNDTIRGGKGNDHIFGVIQQGDVNKCKKFESVIEALGIENLCAQYPSSNTESDKLYGEAGDDNIYGSAGHDYIEGNEGSDRLHGGPGDDILKGGPDNDFIYGGAGKDHLYAEAPGYGLLNLLKWQHSNQFLTGGADTDTYYYNQGDGNVEIDDCDIELEVCVYDADVLKFGPGITVEDISITRSGSDANISFNNGWSGRVILRKQFSEDKNKIGWLEFNDGTRVSVKNLYVGTDYNDQMIFSNAETIFAYR